MRTFQWTIETLVSIGHQKPAEKFCERGRFAVQFRAGPKIPLFTVSGLGFCRLDFWDNKVLLLNFVRLVRSIEQVREVKFREKFHNCPIFYLKFRV